MVLCLKELKEAPGTYTCFSGTPLCEAGQGFSWRAGGRGQGVKSPFSDQLGLVLDSVATHTGDVIPPYHLGVLASWVSIPPPPALCLSHPQTRSSKA